MNWLHFGKMERLENIGIPTLAQAAYFVKKNWPRIYSRPAHLGNLQKPEDAHVLTTVRAMVIALGTKSFVAPPASPGRKRRYFWMNTYTAFGAVFAFTFVATGNFWSR